MAQTPVWKSIESTLLAEISSGSYAPGDKLPTEASLATRFGVNRHTVRRALGEMAESGFVIARRGAGVFVALVPTDYPIGRRVRFHENLRAAGRRPAKEILSLETRMADTREREALGLAQGASIHAYEGLSLADNQPIALFRAVFPAAPFPDLPSDLTETRSVTKALRKSGLADYIRASTRLTAKLATPSQAIHLKIREGSPILRSVGINTDLSGQPIEYGRTWFAGDRVTLTLDD